jgi:hypothetical protein
MEASELVIHLHDLAREKNDNRIRKLADDLTEINNEYRLVSLEEAIEFDKKRNYHYTNTDNPIDFPDGN